MAIKLDALSPAELQALIKNAEAQMESARKNHVQEVRTKIDALLKNAGLTIGEVYPRRGGVKSGKGAKSVVAPKYRNPENPAQTWSGRGKRPAWFSEALKKRGVTAEGMLISGASPAKRASRNVVRKTSPKRTAKK